MAARVRPASKTFQLTVGPSDQKRLPGPIDPRSAGRHPGGSADREAREELGRGRPDAGAGRVCAVFGQPDVRPALEQLGRQPQRHRRGLQRDRPGDRQLGQQVGRVQAQEDAQAVDGLLRRGLEQRDRGRGRGRLGLGAGHVQPAHEPRQEALPCDAGAAGLGLQVPAGDGDPLLERAQVDVRLGDLAREAHEHVAPRRFGPREVRLGGFDRATHPAEEVQLPAGVETGLVQGADVAAVAERAGRPGAPDGRAGVDGRPEEGLRPLNGRAGLPHARFRHLHVQVRLQRAFDEPGEDRVVEKPPPAHERRRDRVGGRRGRLRHAADIGGRHLHTGPLEIGPDHAAGQAERR